MCVGCATRPTYVGFARWGRCKQRSNLPLADLSLTRITYLSKLIEIPSLAAFLQLELFGV
ncbi:hypothetical protein DEH81_13980 [Pectobacterium zantedeschiae]|nr:hypothetical protein DEH81_13980 [Pectobacterium zantedeschiae]